MDVLSEILLSVRSTAPLMADMRMGGRWGIDAEASDAGAPFHYIAAGSCWLILGEERRQLHRGDLVIAPSWPRHALASDLDAPLRPIRTIVAEHGYPQWTPEQGLVGPLHIAVGDECETEILSGIFGFDSANAAFLTEGLPGIMVIQTGQEELSRWLDAMLALIRSERGEAAPGFSAVAGRGMEFVFIHALRTWMLQPSLTAGWLRGLIDPQIGRALRAMHGAPGREWSLAELAAVAGQSRAIFAARFRDVVGETPFGYLTRWRMHQVAARLTRSTDAVATIAHDMGYRSAFSLSRAFRQQLGWTPAEFRRRHRAGVSGRIEAA